MKEAPKLQVHIFLGEDTKRSRDALRRTVDDAKKKDLNVLVSRFDDVSFDSILLREALTSQSLFGGGNIIIIDSILDHAGGEEFYQGLQDFHGTTNFVFIRETAPGKEVRAFFKKIGIIQEFPFAKVIEKKNNFAIADAVATRDKRSAWVEFAKLKRQGAVMEEVHGMIFWAVKALYLSATQTREEAIKAGMKEFTYRTYQPRAKNFLVRELEEKLGELKDMYHAAHQGDTDLGLFLEQFLLKL